MYVGGLVAAVRRCVDPRGILNVEENGYGAVTGEQLNDDWSVGEETVGFV